MRVVAEIHVSEIAKLLLVDPDGSGRHLFVVADHNNFGCEVLQERCL
jgi:hypothetical protein